MSNIGCPCGAVIADTTEDVPGKFYFISDSSWTLIFERAGFALAKTVGDYHSAPKNFDSLEDQLADAMHTLLSRYVHDGYTCASCGRKLLQVDHTSSFKPYHPDE